ncbi:MAG: cell division protein SepF [Bacilli bacterium]|nr:cell division protein SepF [Bacilli bacterium]
MGLFKRKAKKKLEFTEYANYKGKDVKKRASLLTSFDRLVYLIVSDNAQETLLNICDTILSGKAVLANFDKLDSRDANDMLSFVSGVVYAKQGEIYKLDNKLFLFGRKEEFEDGSLYQYVEDSK